MYEFPGQKRPHNGYIVVQVNPVKEAFDRLRGINPERGMPVTMQIAALYDSFDTRTYVPRSSACIEY